MTPWGWFGSSLVELAHWFRRRAFLNVVNEFSLFHNHLPLKEGFFLHLKKLLSPIPKKSLCRVLLKLAQWFWRRWSLKNLRTDGQTDDGQQAFSSGELNTRLGSYNHLRCAVQKWETNNRFISIIILMIQMGMKKV